MKTTTRTGITRNAKAIIALAITLIFATGCKEEEKPKPSEGTEAETVEENKEKQDSVVAETKSDGDSCGWKGYDRKTHFCYTYHYWDDGCNGIDCRYDGRKEKETSFEVMEKCGGEEYNPQKQYCQSGKVKAGDKCGGKEYDLFMNFCYKGGIISKCGGEEYNPEKQFCYSENSDEFHNSDVVEKCDGKKYSPYSSFCHKGELYDLCNLPDGYAYDPETEFCAPDGEGGGATHKKCDDKTYNPATQVCEDGEIKEK